MREALVLLLAGASALALESALLAHAPAVLVPSFALLFPMAAALLLGPFAGLWVCAALGFGADMLSSALFGQHALLRLVEFAAVRAIAGQFDLVRPMPFAAFALGLALADAAASAALIQFFLGSFESDARSLVAVALRGAATAVAAPLVLSLARRVASLGGELDPRREMRLETKRPVL